MLRTVETAAGKVQGAIEEDVYSFKTIPYGASTARENRFLPPLAATPWAGVRDCTKFAGRAPQLGLAPVPGRNLRTLPERPMARRKPRTV
jgi:carboxylesterase type B